MSLILSSASAKTSLAVTDKLIGYDSNNDEFSALLEVLEDALWSRFFPTIATSKFVVGAPEGYAIGTSGALTKDTAYFTPFRIRRATTITHLVQRVVAAGTNIDLAIYASDNTTGRPTGSELCKTGSQSATANTTIDVAPTGGNLSIGYNQTNKPGIYWFGVNTDNASSLTTVRGFSAGSALLAEIFGVASATNAVGNASNQACSAVSTPLTFGTWGNLTSATWTEVSGANASKNAVPMYKTA